MRLIHRTTLIFVLVLILLGLQISDATGQEKANVPLKTSMDEKRQIADLEKIIPALMQKANIPGLSIALIRDGGAVWVRGFGVKSTDNKEPVSEATIFQAASLSKPVFAYAVLQLVDEGKFDLDKPLLDYVSQEYFEENFLSGKLEDERFRKVTARIVMSHMTGLPNWRRRGSALEFRRDPGEKFGYSGEGFVFMQKVIEHVTGKECDEFVRERVFEPLGMTSSSYVWMDDYDKRTASSHGLFLNTRKMRKDTRANAAASLKTTAGDYAKFLIAVIDGSGLKPETHKALLTPQSETDSNGVKWGLGIGLQESGDSGCVWHWGDNGDYKAFALASVKEKIGVVYFANSFNGLAIVNDVVDTAVGGDNPVLASSFLEDYARYDSNAFKLTGSYVTGGMEDFLELYHQFRRDPEHEKKGVNEALVNYFGYGLMRLKKYDDAITVFKLNVEAYPESSNVYDSLGEAYMKNGDFEPALENYRKSLELNPNNDNARQIIQTDAFSIYKAYIDGGIQAFIKLYRELKLNPDHEKRGLNENFINQFGYGLINAKRYPDAIEVFKLNVEAYPGSCNVYDSLGEAFMMNGDLEPALENYRKSLELCPNNEGGRQAIDKLELALTNIRSAAGWQQYTTPEEAGFDSATIEDARKYASEIGSAAVMAVYDGRVLAAWGHTSFPYMCHSVRKSFLSGMYGIYVDKKKIDINKTLAELGIDDEPPLTQQEKQAKVTDMLKARSGVYHPAAYETESMKAARPARDSHAPGTFWYYNNWDFNTLAYIFEQETGKKVFEEFKAGIANPLAMEDFDLRHCYYHLEAENSIYPAYPFRMSARDAARYGQLFLQQGEWAGKEIIPSSWVKESATSYSEARIGGYAYMWWTYSPEDCREQGWDNLAEAGGFYSAQGVGGQVIAVIDGADIVLVHRTDTDRGKRVNYLHVFKMADMILGARTGEPKAEPKLAVMNPTPFESADKPPILHVEIEMDPGLYDAYVGTYKAEPPVEIVFEVSKSDNRLWAAMTGESTVELFPEAMDKFFIKAGNVPVNFLRDENGVVTHLIMRDRDQDLKAVRVDKQ